MDAVDNHMDMIQGNSLTPVCEFCGRYQHHDTLPCAKKEVKRLKTKVDQLQKERAAAIRLLQQPGRIAWGWNPEAQEYGYYLGHLYSGATIGHVLAVQAELNDTIDALKEKAAEAAGSEEA